MLKPITRRALVGQAAAVSGLSLFSGKAKAFPRKFSGSQASGGGGGGGGGGGTLVTTMTLVNTSGSTQAAGFVTPTFGQSFKQGDMPPGQYPQFEASGVNQPWSGGLYSFWPDGSMKHGSFFFRSTASIAGNGTLTVNVLNGGTAPAASARTLTELYSQSIVVNGVGAGSNFGLSGTWSAWVNGDANQTEAYVYLDGAAGRTWRIKNHFAQTQGGAAHGQLECYSYVTALTDGSGALGGYRFLPRVTQPYYDYDGPPAKDWRGFSSMSWQHGSGPTTVPLNWPFNPVTVTATVSNTTFATSTHNYYSGAALTNGSGNVVPGIFTTTGTLPAPLSANTIYFASTLSPSSNVTQLIFSPDSAAQSVINPTSTGTGTHTFTPIPTCLHFGAIWFADTSGKSNFFQGAGSMSADNTIRTQFNRNYLHSTTFVPPWSLAVSGTTFGGTINDFSFPYNYNPFSSGPIATSTRGAAGGSEDIGPLTSYHAIHFYNQSAQGDLLVRAMAFCADFDCTGSFRSVSTNNYVNLSNNTYTGMNAPSSTLQNNLYFVVGVAGGFTAPTNGTCFALQEQNFSHKPSMAFYAALVFGEAHFVDLCIEEAIGAPVEFLSTNRNPASPLPVGFGVTTALPGSTNCRTLAWQNRTVQLGAFLAPLNHPDGSQSCQYIRDLADADCDYFNSVLSNSLIGSYLNGLGHWVAVATPLTQADTSCGGFQRTYMLMSQCIAAARGNTTALSFLSSYSTGLQHIISTFGAWHLYIEYDHAVMLDASADNTGAVITSDNEWGIAWGGFTLSWTTSTRAFSVNSTPGGWTPAAGDKWIFDASETIPSGFSSETPYYAVNVSGLAFDLSASIGGSAITPGSSGSQAVGGGPAAGISGPWLVIANPPAASTGSVPAGGQTGADTYLTEMQTLACWATAVGATGYSGVLTDANTRITANSVDFTSNPNFLSQSSF